MTQQIKLDITKPEDALQFLEHIASSTDGNRQYHESIIAAAATIRAVITPKPEKKDDPQTGKT